MAQYNPLLRDTMLIEEIFCLTTQLSSTVRQKARLDNTKIITRDYIEKVADDSTAIKDHVAKDIIISRVFFDI